MKRTLSLIFAALFMLSFVCLPKATFAASACPYGKDLGKINSFNDTISDLQYDVLSSGTISAVKKSNTWYYKFTDKNRNTVLVKQSAFTQKVSNSFSKVNSELAKGVSSKNTTYTPSYIYKTYSSSKLLPSALIGQQKGSEKSGTSTTIQIAKLNFLSSLDSDVVVLGCFIDAERKPITFTYASIVPKKGQRNFYVKPSTAEEYTRALTRKTNTKLNLQPVLKLSVDKAGKNCVVLKTFNYQSVGSVSKKYKVDEWVDVAFTVGKIVAETAAKKFPTKSLWDLVKTGMELKEINGEFTFSKPYSLSRNVNGKDYKILSSTFKSPVKLTCADDYVVVTVRLSKVPDAKTKLSASFSLN